MSNRFKIVILPANSFPLLFEFNAEMHPFSFIQNYSYTLTHFHHMGFEIIAKTVSCSLLLMLLFCAKLKKEK